MKSKRIPVTDNGKTVESSHFKMSDNSSKCTTTSTITSATLSTTTTTSIFNVPHDATSDATILCVNSSLENIAEKIEPTKKASNLLVQALMEQKQQHDRKKEKEAIRPILTRVLRSRNHHTKKPALAMTRKKSLLVMKELIKPAEKSLPRTRAKIIDTQRDNSEIDEVPDGFGRLRLDRIDDFDIPIKIIKIEKDKSHLTEVERLMEESESNCGAYVKAYSALLHLEEVAEMTSLKQYNRSVRLTYSNTGKRFLIKIEVSDDLISKILKLASYISIFPSNSHQIDILFFQKNTSEIVSAIEESLIDHFTLSSPHQFFPKMKFCGRVLRCDEKNIHVEIFKEKDSSTLKTHCKVQPFDICFTVNRLPYQMQHKTLKLVEQFNLHSLLINNENYEHRPNHNNLDYSCLSYTIRGKLTADLNEEQKLAVISILKMNKSMPYLLFGPAGIHY